MERSIHSFNSSDKLCLIFLNKINVHRVLNFDLKKVFSTISGCLTKRHLKIRGSLKNTLFAHCFRNSQNDE